MTSTKTLGLLSTVLLLTACATADPLDDVAIKQECQCKCVYGDPPMNGTFTFPSEGPDCSFTAIDRYIPCQDSQGQTRAGVSYSDCEFKGVLPPNP